MKNQLSNPDEYTKEEKTMNVFTVNFFAFVIFIPVILIFGIPFYVIWKDSYIIENIKIAFDQFRANYYWLVPIIILVGIVVHELIHGITWSLFTNEGFKSIRFGVVWKALTPYCHCKEPLKIRHYVLGALMPGIVMGILPAIVAIMVGNIGLLLFGIFFTGAAGGDFMTTYLLRKEKGNDFVEDHPDEMGCFVYRKIG